MTRVLPTGWEKLKVQDVSKIYLGLTHTPQYIDNGIPFLSVKNISAGKIDFKDTKFISKEEFNSLPDGAKPQKGDMLFARVGTLGCPSIVDTEQPFGTFVSLGFFRVNKNKILNTYIRYWMMSPSFWEQVNINVQGSTLKNLNTGWLKNFEINVPSLPEQKRIVEKLDKIFSGIDKAKENTTKNLQNAKDVFKNSLSLLLEQDKEKHPITSLGQVATLIPGIAFKSKEFGNFPQKVVKITNILPPKISNSLDGVDICAYNKEKISKYLLRKGDICVAMTGGTIGKLGMYDLNGETYVNQRVLLIRSTSAIDYKFLHYILMHPKFLLFIKSNIESDTAQPNISADTIGKYKFFLPTIDKQKVLLKRLTEFENKTQELEQIYTKKLADLEELKQSVLQQAFSGKL